MRARGEVTVEVRAARARRAASGGRCRHSALGYRPRGGLAIFENGFRRRLGCGHDCAILSCAQHRRCFQRPYRALSAYVQTAGGLGPADGDFSRLKGLHPQSSPPRISVHIRQQRGSRNSARAGGLRGSQAISRESGSRQAPRPARSRSGVLERYCASAGLSTSRYSRSSGCPGTLVATIGSDSAMSPTSHRM
jgi:hypothetical protein